MGLLRKAISISVASTGVPAVSFHSQKEKNTRAIKGLRKEQASQHRELIDVIQSQGVLNPVYSYEAETSFVGNRPVRTASQQDQSEMTKHELLRSLENLERVFALNKSGVLTDDEFAAEKNKRLSQFIND